VEGQVAAHQVILVTAVRVTGRVGVVLEEQDVAGDAVLAESLLGLVQEVLDDTLTGLVVDHELGDVVALRRRVFGMESRVEIEPRTVFQEHVGVARAGDDLLEEVASDVVGRQAALTVECAGQAILVLEAEDPSLHELTHSLARARNGRLTDIRVWRDVCQPVREVPARYRAVARSWFRTSGGRRRNFRRVLVRSRTATSRSRSVRLLFCVTLRARTPSWSASSRVIPSLKWSLRKRRISSAWPPIAA